LGASMEEEALAAAVFVGVELKVFMGVELKAFMEAGVKVPTVAEDTLPVPMESQAPRLLTVPSTRILAAAPPIKDLEGATRLKEPTGADTRTALMEVKLRGDRKVMRPPEVLKAVLPRRVRRAITLRKADTAAPTQATMAGAIAVEV